MASATIGRKTTVKIAYCGNFQPTHSTENHYARSFEALGHEVWRLQENASDAWHEHIDGYPDLCIWTRTWGLDGFGKLQFAHLASQNVPTVGLHLDRWFGLAREHEVTEREGLTMFDCSHVFTADGESDELFEHAGVHHHWLRPGVVADEAVDAEPDPEWEGKWDVAFVGSAPTERGGNYHSEWPHRGLLVAWLEDTYGDRFVHVGNGGHLGNNNPEPNFRGEKINRFYRSVPVIVGDSALAKKTGRYWSERAYEAWGRGAFMVHPQIDALEAEIGTYPSWTVGDWDALRRTIDLFLSKPDYREERRREIAHVVRTRCTYTDRARELLEVVCAESGVCAERAA